MADNPVLVEVWRSGFLESVHRGSLVVLDADGDGRRSRPVRSTGRSCRGRRTSRCRRRRCWRPAGRRARSEELAIAAGSHNGEDGHRELVAAMLAAAGLGAERPRLPAALPAARADPRRLDRGGPARPTRLAMNCSGKHAGDAVGLRGRRLADRRATCERDHPLQQAIEARLAEAAGEPVTAVVVDGCGAPQHALLASTGLARGVLSLVQAPDGQPGTVGRRRDARPPLVRRRHRPRRHRRDARRPRAAGEGRGRRRARRGPARPRCGGAEAGRRRRSRADARPAAPGCVRLGVPGRRACTVVADAGARRRRASSARCAPAAVAGASDLRIGL